MIPLQLLRAKVFNRGKSIAPIFCTSDQDLSLADNIIRELEESLGKGERKGLLMDRIGLVEGEHDDYKLVRGLFILLERRCTFVKGSEQSSKKTIDSDGIVIEPQIIRRRLFEESSKREFALTPFKREEIIQIVAAELGVDKENVINEMWSDLEENLVLQNFDRITPATLVAWYNLSLMQTLLFNCTNLQVSLHGGSSWKRVLRDVKRVGLMYNIQNQPVNEINRTTSKDASYHDHIVLCSIDGPLSIFKMTDLYGTAIAKIVPSIISAESWSLDAWIVRNHISIGRKIYEFHISKKDTPPLIGSPDLNYSKNITAKSNSYFDSSVEERFAIKFQQARTGWTLMREPNPIIVNNNKAFIPDFMFERYGHRVYLEIVGFWTSEYIERKIHKLTQISSQNKEQHDEAKVDILIAADNNYYISSNRKVEKDVISVLNLSVQDNHLILYKNGQVPLKPIISYLKSIDQIMIEKFAGIARNDLLSYIDTLNSSHSENNGHDDLVSINDLAEKYNIPFESVLLALRSSESGNLNDNVLSYIIVGTHLIPRAKILELQKSLNSISSFMDAILLFKKYKIPESCHVDLISKLGYDIIWKGIDSTNASLERRKI